MKIAINRTNQNKMPDPLPAGWWAAFNGTFENEEIDAAAVLMYVHYGWAYCAQHADYRKAENFTAAQHIDLDLDNGRLTLDDLLHDDFIRNNAAFIHETASSSPEEPRLRVFFELDRPIRDAHKYRLLRDALLHRYPMADKAHRDVCRLAFGSRDCNHVWLGNVLTLEVAAAEIVQPYKQATAPRSKEKKPFNSPTTAQNDVPGYFLAAKREYLLRTVETATDGLKFDTLRRIAVTFGGYIKAGYYNESDIRDALGDAIRANRNNVKNLAIADKCIDDGLEFGQQRPLFITSRQYRPMQQSAGGAARP